MIAKSIRGWSRRTWPGLVVSMLMASHAMAATTDTHPRRTASETPQSRRAPASKASVLKSSVLQSAAPKSSILKGGGAKVAGVPTRRARVQLASARMRLGGADGASTTERDGMSAYDADQEAAATASGSGYGASGFGSSGVGQTGLASWYGGRAWNGHRTSDGGQFSDTELTAAHATLPMGSLVRVTLGSSDRSVVVRINDRPGTRRRIIDLSRAAAEKLGMLGAGVAVVTLSPL